MAYSFNVFTGTLDISGGTGNVTGPLSSTNNAYVIFDGTTGKILKDSLHSYDVSTASAITTFSFKASVARTIIIPDAAGTMVVSVLDTNSIDLTLDSAGQISADLLLSAAAADAGHFNAVSSIEADGLQVQVSHEDVQDVVGAMLTDSNSIDFSYDDTGGTLTGSVIIQDTATVDLSIDGSGLKADVIQSGLDHGSISGLGDDDHTQYALLAGRNLGQTLIGGTGSGDDLVLTSTSHATKGTVRITDITEFTHNGGLYLYEDSTNGTSYIRFKAPVGLGANFDIVLPTAAASTDNRVMMFNTSGDSEFKPMNARYNVVTDANASFSIDPGTYEGYVIRATNVAARAITITTAGLVVGASLVFKDSAGTASSANITITLPGGHSCEGSSTVLIQSDYGSITLVYTLSNTWEII